MQLHYNYIEKCTCTGNLQNYFIKLFFTVAHSTIALIYGKNVSLTILSIKGRLKLLMHINMELELDDRITLPNDNVLINK